MSSPNAPIESSIEIDAPPARVWEIVSEVRNAPQWSSQAVKVYASGGATTLGTHSFNLNKQGPVYWPTWSRVVAFEPERRIANRTGGHGTVWSFELTPTPTGGTRLVQRQEIPALLTSAVGAVTSRLPGAASGEASSGSRGPSGALRRIKSAAERG